MVAARVRIALPVAAAVALCVTLANCSAPSSRPLADDTTAASLGIDSLNARVIKAYRDHDPKYYATLYTGNAVFEWPAFNTVRGRAGLESMARSNWASLASMDLALQVSQRKFAAGHATEFGSFQQSWRDSSGARMTEYGRYVTTLTREADKMWRIDHFFGFEDSTRSRSPRS